MAASHHERPAKNANGEYATFVTALKKVLSVSHSDIKAQIKLAKRKRQSKRSSASRAVNAKG